MNIQYQRSRLDYTESDIELEKQWCIHLPMYFPIFIAAANIGIKGQNCICDMHEGDELYYSMNMN